MSEVPLYLAILGVLQSDTVCWPKAGCVSHMSSDSEALAPNTNEHDPLFGQMSEESVPPAVQQQRFSWLSC